jgi:hypothetical protein
VRPDGRSVRISQRPVPIARHNGMPVGQRHCARNKSLPTVWRSVSGSAFSHSRTGSPPAAVRKKISGIFSGDGCLIVLGCCPPFPPRIWWLIAQDILSKAG